MSFNSSHATMVGVIGLGPMGSSFAANLAAAGVEVIARDHLAYQLRRKAAFRQKPDVREHRQMNTVQGLDPVAISVR